MRIPAALPAIALAAGAAAGACLPAASLVPGALLAISTAAAALAWRRAPRLFLPCTLCGFALSGAALGAHAADRAARSSLRALHDERLLAGGAARPLSIEGRLIEDAAPTDYGASVVLRVGDAGVRLSVGGSLAWSAAREWRAGRRLRATAALRVPAGFRNPGGRDEASALARRGIALIGSVKSAALVEVVDRGHPAAEAAAALRARVRDAVARRLGPHAPQSAAIVTAILIGDRAGLDPDVERRLQEAGTYHVIAISGGNIAVLAGAALVLLRLSRAPGRTAAAVTVAILGAYGYAAAGGPSVNRATLAAMLYLSARLIDHRAPALNALAVVLGIAVLRAPLDLFDPGLALSYGATLALLIGAEKGVGYVFGRRRPTKGTRQVVGLGIATMCAEIAVLPIGALAFGRVTAAGLVLNFIAIPLMAVVQLAGLGLVVFDAFLPPLADLAARVAHLGTVGVVSSTSLVAAAPWLTWRVPAPPVWTVVLYYGSCALALTTRRWRHQAIALAIGCGAIIASPVAVRGLTADAAAPPRTLRVTVLDVGQGDATLVDLPSGRRVLVDTGGLAASTFDIGGRVVAPALMALGARRLHAVAITHPDPDHIGGAASVLRDFRTVEIWDGVPVPPHPARRALAAQAARLGAGWRMLRRGDRLSDGEVEIDVLHPPPPDWERQRPRNDDSIVLDVRLGNVSIVLPGDIGRDIERTIAPLLRPAAIRILKAAHHGSATSTSADFLRAAKPAAVIFSAGRDNRYGHPAASVLARVRATRARVYRTDDQGAVTISTDGQRVTISTVSGSTGVFRSVIP